MTPTATVTALLITAALIIAALSAALGFILGGAYQYRRTEAARAALIASLAAAERSRETYRIALRNTCTEMERAQARHAAEIGQMRRECEDQLLWAFREANRANRRLAMVQRASGAIVWPESVEWGEN